MVTEQVDGTTAEQQSAENRRVQGEPVAGRQGSENPRSKRPRLGLKQGKGRRIAREAGRCHPRVESASTSKEGQQQKAHYQSRSTNQVDHSDHLAVRAKAVRNGQPRKKTKFEMPVLLILY